MNDAVLDHDREGGELDVFIKVIQSRPRVELPTVPRANDIVSVQIALSEWTAGMRACSFDAMELAVDIADGIQCLTQFHLFDCAWREFIERFDLH